MIHKMHCSKKDHTFWTPYEASQKLIFELGISRLPLLVHLIMQVPDEGMGRKVMQHLLIV